MALEQRPLPSDDADLTLVERFARGDSAAYDEIVRKYQPRIAGLAYRLLGWRDDVEDVVQEVFLAALKALPRFRGQAGLSTWLTRITINKCRSSRRRRMLSLRRWISWTAGRGEPEAASAEGSAADRPTLDHEKFERVRQAISRLPARYREAIVLRYLEQMSVEEVAEAMSARPETIQVLLHRARNRLRGALGDLAKE